MGIITGVAQGYPAGTRLILDKGPLNRKNQQRKKLYPTKPGPEKIRTLAPRLFVTLMKFLVETVMSVLGSICREDWMFSIDLKDAYFQIPIHQGSRPYLCFCLKRHVYQFWALCFSLSTAPQVFTKVFALVSEWAHRRDMRLLHYLDDWLVVAELRDLLLQHQDLLLQLCDDLGIVMNWEKSDLQPFTRLQYLGMLIDTSLE